jgi:CubicO group peptidase (beta-lactamase class C family)
MRLIRLICSGLVVARLMAISPASAQQPANPAVDSIFADLEKPDSPGCALGVYRNSKIIYAKGYGLADLEQSVPITPQTVFDVGSISKQFTVASILLLEKHGKLRLDDEVRKYIPELPDYSRDGPKITILQLLNHTSGLRDYVSLLLLAGNHYDNVTTDDDAFGIILRQRGLNFSPGTEWKYTGSGYLLLSVIVKRLSGKTLKDFTAENIFQPLGMSHSQFRNDHTSLIPNRALAYERDENGAYKLSVSYGEENGDGMVHTSIEDLQKWDENFYSGQIGGKDLVAEMQEPGKLNDGQPLRYGKGLFIRDYRGLPTVWHGGESAGYLAYLVRFPAQHFSIACLCNGPNSPFHRAHRVAQVFLRDQMKGAEVDFATAGPERNSSASASFNSEHLRAWSGVYRNSKNDELWQITEKRGTLWLDGEDVSRPLFPLSASEFEPLRYIYQTHLKFEPAQNGLPRRLILSREMQPLATLEAVQPPTPSAAELAAYAGEYWSDELGSTYRLAMHEGVLWMKDLIGADGIVHRGIIPSGELRPIMVDVFALNGAPLVFHFKRDEKTNVTGFALRGFSERGILFTKVGKTK